LSLGSKRRLAGALVLGQKGGEEVVEEEPVFVWGGVEGGRLLLFLAIVWGIVAAGSAGFYGVEGA